MGLTKTCELKCGGKTDISSTSVPESSIIRHMVRVLPTNVYSVACQMDCEICAFSKLLNKFISECFFGGDSC